MSAIGSGSPTRCDSMVGPGITSQSPAHSCRQCRARKVKCDRRSTGCRRCEKIGLPCSYLYPGSPSADVQQSSEVDALSSGDLTEAGTKRRRIRRACDACRKTKSRCSGDQPCSKCVSTGGAQCTYEGNHIVPSSVPKSARMTMRSGHAAAPGINTQSHVRNTMQATSASPASPFDVSSVAGTIATGTTTTGSSRASIYGLQLGDLDLSRKDTVRRCLDAFFSNTDLIDCPFLHRASVIAKWNKNELDPTLVQAICALGLRLHIPGQEDNGSTSRMWMDNVRTALSRSRWASKIPNLQALMLLVKFMFTCSFTEEIWILLSVAARMAYIQKLNHETSATGNAVKQECRRRLMWSIFLHDKLFCGGTEDLSVCPTKSIHVRLPSNDYCFQRGLSSRSQFLKASPADDSYDMDAVAYRLRLLDLRDRVLRYTKQVIRDDASPIASRDQLESLDAELRVFRDSLPEDLQLNPDRLTVMCHSPEASSYITLHLTLLLCRCDLHRFLVPGIREGVSATALAATPPDFIAYCQQACLDGALALCDFFSELEALEMGRIIDTPTLTITVYQTVKIIGRLTFLLPASGPYCLEELKGKLTQGLSLARPMQARIAWLKPCVTAIERLIPRLGSQTRTSPGSPTSDDQGAKSGHLWSKYVFAPGARKVGDGATEARCHEESALSASGTVEGDSGLAVPQTWPAATGGLNPSESWQIQEQLPFVSHDIPRDSYLLGLDEASLISPLGFCDLELYAYSDAGLTQEMSAFGA